MFSTVFTCAGRTVRLVAASSTLALAITLAGAAGAGEATRGTTQTPDVSAPPADDEVVVRRHQLIGRWSDHPGTAFGSVWEFGSSKLRFKRYDKPVGKSHRYTLEGNVLTVHHDSTALRPEPHDEKMRIVAFTGDTLTWLWGSTRVTLHRD